ncbi:hypothetical protein ACM3F9_004511 [Escherichia coli]|uniref:hypothetical protein n=1 Tax=Escherichia coli TaxID=562 RepID=UPI000BE9FBD2|nr:hypothetical protein [Escherichia coli]
MSREQVVILTKENFTLRQELVNLQAAFLDQQRVLNALQTERLHAEAQRLSQEREQYEEEVKFKEEFSSS